LDDGHRARQRESGWIGHSGRSRRRVSFVAISRPRSGRSWVSLQEQHRNRGSLHEGVRPRDCDEAIDTKGSLTSKCRDGHRMFHVAVADRANSSYCPKAHARHRTTFDSESRAEFPVLTPESGKAR
jgi:hypothetical protein